MRLTKFSDYALRTLIYAAGRQGTLATVEETARFFGISRAHLKKVVMRLSSAGYLEAARGHGGGFRLARPATDINLGALLRTTEPDFGLVECFVPGNACRITALCHLPCAFNEALAAFLATLDRFSLADLELDPGQFDGAFYRVSPAPVRLRGPRLPDLSEH